MPQPAQPLLLAAAGGRKGTSKGLLRLIVFVLACLTFGGIFTFQNVEKVTTSYSEVSVTVTETFSTEKRVKRRRGFRTEQVRNVRVEAADGTRGSLTSDHLQPGDTATVFSTPTGALFETRPTVSIGQWILSVGGLLLGVGAAVIGTLSRRAGSRRMKELLSADTTPPATIELEAPAVPVGSDALHAVGVIRSSETAQLSVGSRLHLLGLRNELPPQLPRELRIHVAYRVNPELLVCVAYDGRQWFKVNLSTSDQAAELLAKV